MSYKHVEVLAGVNPVLPRMKVTKRSKLTYSSRWNNFNCSWKKQKPSFVY